MKTKSVFLRVLSLSLSLICLGLSLCSCQASKDSVDATTVVGTVGGKEVYYDEIYYLIHGYKDLVKEACGEDPVKQNEKYRSLIAQNLPQTYAMLALCEKMGLTYDEKELKDEIDKRASAYIAQYFTDEEDFHVSRNEQGLTDRYFRYLLGTELLYSDLLTIYPQKGLVPSSDAELRAAIKENFIHVYHLVIFNDPEDDPDANLSKIQSAHQKLTSGEASMYDLIKGGYSEDFSDPSGKGYYLVKGTMEPEYEEAAFALDINQISPVVTSRGTNNSDRLVSCYYVIQRFALDEDYVKENFYALQQEYYGSVIASDMEELRKTLVFEPNEFYDSLDMTKLPTVRESSVPTVLWICLGAGVALIAVAAIVTVILLKRKHKKKNLPV